MKSHKTLDSRHRNYAQLLQLHMQHFVQSVYTNRSIPVDTVTAQRRGNCLLFGNCGPDTLQTIATMAHHRGFYYRDQHSTLVVHF